MTPRKEIELEVLAARDCLMTVGSLIVPRTLAMQCNEAIARIGTPNNNDRTDLVQIAALAMAMAECAALTKDHV